MFGKVARDISPMVIVIKSNNNQKAIERRMPFLAVLVDFAETHLW